MREPARARAEGEGAEAEEARSRLDGAEALLDGLARRVGALAPEERARVVRQLVPRVVVELGEGRKERVFATYAFAPPPETYSRNCPASSSSLT